MGVRQERFPGIAWYSSYRHSRHLPPSNCGQIPLRPGRRGRYRDDRAYSRAAKCVRIANGRSGSRRNTGARWMAEDGKRARIPPCNSLRWIRAESQEFLPFRCHRWHRVWAKGAGVTRQRSLDSGKDSFRFYEGILSFVPAGSNCLLFLARVCFTTREKALRRSGDPGPSPVIL